MDWSVAKFPMTAIYYFPLLSLLPGLKKFAMLKVFLVRFFCSMMLLTLSLVSSKRSSSKYLDSFEQNRLPPKRLCTPELHHIHLISI
ncbi:hypothetical protein BC427_04445 [Ralstonia solanacearum FJAT-91]|uniref:Transmembrane protein n=1 Tax=Ralstonia solanacearum TaxID=305 RepID=A0A0S4VAW4_RALSL|nr:hypothetical protein BC427_04445 [Ralstonia solanacearum FJAT-91]CUV31796.1 protein of unknown function [Ralstonia solanacearum]